MSSVAVMRCVNPAVPTERAFPLSNEERRVLSLAIEDAAAGRPLRPNAEIAAELGSQNYDGGTVPGIMRRLEAKGYITREIYQRGRQVCIVSTGQCTAPPKDTSPHWRLRTDRVPSPAIQAVRQKRQDVCALIEQEARRLGKPMSDFLADLVYIGWHSYDAERNGA